MTALARALGALRDLDTEAARDTPLAHRDPRAKLLVTLGFLVALTAFDRYQVASLLPLSLYPVWLAVQSDLPARLMGRALALALPLALLLGLFNPLLDRAPMLVLGGVTLSGGFVSLVAILLRATLAACAGLILIASTGMPAVCGALSRLGAPRAFAIQLQLVYRFLFVLLEEGQRLLTARALRAGARQRLDLAEYAPLLGQWLVRSIERAARVHQAMLARGFKGELLPAGRWHWTPADTLFTAGWLVFFAATHMWAPAELVRLLFARSGG
jgi:cobalt/nickel transport system permease protein